MTNSVLQSLSAAVASLFLLALPASAWDIDKMNEQIEKTNVIVSEICSGTVIDVKERLVLTAHHCTTGNIREVEKREVDEKTGDVHVRKVVEKTPMFISVWKYGEDSIVSEQKYSAVIRGYDAATDVAILQVVDTDWKPMMAAPLAKDSYQYKRGKPVFAVGNPGILFDNSVTTGIISAPQRNLDFGSGHKIPLFQHSASTMGGSSGGAIYNDEGEIIGTLTGGMRGVDISLSVPISKTKALLKKIGLEKIYQ